MGETERKWTIKLLETKNMAARERKGKIEKVREKVNDDSTTFYFL